MPRGIRPPRSYSCPCKAKFLAKFLAKRNSCPRRKTIIPQSAKKTARARTEPAPPQNPCLYDQPKRGVRAGPAADRPPPGPPGPPVVGFGFIGNKPSRCNRLRASLRARRIPFAFSRAFFSEGFS